MHPAVHDELEASAAEAARGHPADIDRALSAGAKRFRRRLLFVNGMALLGAALAIGAIGVYASAGSDTAGRASTRTPNASQLTTLSLAPDDPTIELDTSQQLTATGAYSDGTSQVVTDSVAWDSSNNDVATVTGGLVTAEGPGTTTITAISDNDIRATSQVTVPTPPPHLTRIDVDGETSEVCPPDETLQLIATGTYSDGTTESITKSDLVSWKSSDSSFATVDETGLVKPQGPEGSAVITAASGSLSDSFKVSCTFVQ